MVRKYVYDLIFLSLLFHLFSCASSPPLNKENISRETNQKEIESSMKISAMNEKILMGTLSSRRAAYGDYKIGSEDLLEISVFEDEKLNKTVRVSSQGNISLPLLGVIRVKGLTASELEREIRDLLTEKYFQDPHVTVFIKEFRSQRISVIGAIEKPGVLEVSGEKTILDVLGMVGGLRQDAGQKLFLIRPPQAAMERKPTKEQKEPEDPPPQIFVVDLDELLIKGDLALNLPLLNGDVINVPMSGKVFVGGQVKSPGGFPLGKRLTLSQAITLAGGLKYEGDASNTRIFRYSGKGPDKEILSGNIYAIQKGQEEDLYLKEYDIVFVPRSGSKTFFKEMWDFLKSKLYIPVL